MALKQVYVVYGLPLFQITYIIPFIESCVDSFNPRDLSKIFKHVLVNYTSFCAC